MKKIIFTLMAFVFSIGAFAQKTLPEIKVGTVFNCSAYVQGQEFPLLLSVKSMAGPVSIGWSVDGYDGTFDMTAKALESATKMLAVTQPSLGATKLADDETFGLISKAAYQTLAEKKAFTYGGINFKVKLPDTAPMKISGKEIDATHVISEDGKIELWILNNAAFPFVLQSAGLSTDIVVAEIK